MSNPSNSAARIIALRSELEDALNPVQLTRWRVEPVPGLAALSFLVSRQVSWEVHALTVGFVMDQSSGERNPRALVRTLAGQPLSKWLDGSELRSYVERQPVFSSRDQRSITSQMIDNAIDASALQAAQLGTVRWEYCKATYDSDHPRLLRCMFNELNGE